MTVSKMMFVALGAFLLSACVADEQDVRVSGLSASQNLERLLLIAKKHDQKRTCGKGSGSRPARVDTGRGRGISQRYAVTSRPAVALGTNLEPLHGIMTSRKPGC